MVEIISDTQKVKIRKDRQCLFCFRVFPKGSEMLVQVCKSEGDIYSVYSCETCQRLISAYPNTFVDDCDNTIPQGITAEYAIEFGVSIDDLLEAMKGNS